MFIHSRTLGSALLGLVLCSATAWAAAPVLQGFVKDPGGRPVKGAEIRIEARNRSGLSKVVKTDSNGRYVSTDLPAGNYRVSLLVDGAVKASINNVTTKLGDPTQLNFNLKQATASKTSGAAKKATHMVWMPPETGTNIGGRWVEVDDNGNADTAGADNVKKWSGNAVRELQNNSAVKNSSGGGH